MRSSACSPSRATYASKLDATRSRARVVLEVGAHSPWVSRLLEELGHEVLVANARRMRAIAESQQKTDENDAELLAGLGRADPELLAPLAREVSHGTIRDVPWDFALAWWLSHSDP